MSRPAEGIRVGMLGAVGGLFSVSLFLLIARVDSYYDYLAQPIGAYYYPDRSVENLWWIPVAFWHVLLSAVASLVVHRLQATGPKSNFLVWQAVGIVAFFGWLLTFSCFLGLGSLMHGDLDQASMIVKSLAPGFIAKYVATVFAGNVLYGSTMHAASQQYLKNDSDHTTVGPYQECHSGRDLTRYHPQ